ncbi:hypothetical protein BSZ21_04380 [Bradyrhizobium canariense]|nr:hypothetical protein BSZ21_04380 [Bradyrhizobium canariense]
MIFQICQWEHRFRIEPLHRRSPSRTALALMSSRIGARTKRINFNNFHDADQLASCRSTRHE